MKEGPTVQDLQKFDEPQAALADLDRQHGRLQFLSSPGVSYCCWLPLW